MHISGIFDPKVLELCVELVYSISILTRIKKKRKGVHSKTKTSNIKTSKHYVKKYKGQGK